jgi:hypothetical protein
MHTERRARHGHERVPREMREPRRHGYPSTVSEWPGGVEAMMSTEVSHGSCAAS